MNQNLEIPVQNTALFYLGVEVLGDVVENVTINASEELIFWSVQRNIAITQNESALHFLHINIVFILNDKKVNSV